MNRIDYAFLTNQFSRQFDSFATVRFDLEVQEEVAFFEKEIKLSTYIDNHLPTPSLSFKNASTPTNAIHIARDFAANTSACGAVLFLLVKRNADSQDVSETVSLLQSHRMSVYIAASDQLIGGSSAEPLYELSTRTNGVCAFHWDLNELVDDVLRLLLYSPLYAVNVAVHGQGVKYLPNLPSSHNAIIYSALTVEGHPLDTTPFNFTVSFNVDEFSGRNPNGFDLHGTLSVNAWKGLNESSVVSLLFYYPMSAEVLQLRWSSVGSVTSWPVYDNDF